MKDSEEKDHRISNLKDMISNVTEGDDKGSLDDIEEDLELIEYLNEDKSEDLEIDDEFIYHPDEDGGDAINLEETPIDEDFIIKAPSENEVEENKENDEGGDAFDEFSGELSESFDNLVNAKVGKTPLLAIVSAVLGAIFLGLSAYVFSTRSERIIDNVVSGETNVITVGLLILGVLFLAYGLYKIIGFRNPMDGWFKSIDSIEDEDKKNAKPEKDEPTEKVIPKSKIPLDKESYKIGEFSFKDLKNKLKPSKPKPAPPTQEEIDKIPPAREKPEEKKGLTSEEIEELEYNQAVLEGESIDDIFAEVEDIDDIPIISIDDEKEK